MGNFKEQNTDWSEHPKTETMSIIANYIDSLQFTVELPNDKTEDDILTVYVMSGIAYIYFKDGTRIKNLNYMHVEPNYSESIHTESKIKTDALYVDKILTGEK